MKHPTRCTRRPRWRQWWTLDTPSWQPWALPRKSKVIRNHWEKLKPWNTSRALISRIAETQMMVKTEENVRRSSIIYERLEIYIFGSIIESQDGITRFSFKILQFTSSSQLLFCYKVGWVPLDKYSLDQTYFNLIWIKHFQDDKISTIIELVFYQNARAQEVFFTHKRRNWFLNIGFPFKFSLVGIRGFKHAMIVDWAKSKLLPGRNSLGDILKIFGDLCHVLSNSVATLIPSSPDSLWIRGEEVCLRLSWA